MQRTENWKETYAQLLKADQEHALAPTELETLALSAYLTGRDAQSFQILERAHQCYLGQRKTEPAVRCAFWLGLILMHAGERARSSGWMARAERLLNDDARPDCAERGLLLIPAALGELAAGRAARAQKLFEKAAITGEQFCDANLIALARLGHGQSMIEQGDIANGLKLLDETMIIIETEEVFPVVNGIVYCAVIETCRKVWDLKRAQEWTSSFSRWCDAQPDIVPFRGQCLVCRAEIIQFHGEWHLALGEINEACEQFAAMAAKSATGEAFYRKAELHRLLGDFMKAQHGYHNAAKWGRRPQPGLALLRLAQGQCDAAATSISTTLNETKDTRTRAELLPDFARIMIAVKHIDKAREASRELRDISNDMNAPYLYAMSSYCQGAVSLAEGNAQPALIHLQQALKFWDTLHMPYESARTRELKALAYRELNDRDNSDAELTAAKWVFEQLNAKPDVQRINQLLSRKPGLPTYGLTLRELQVLRLVASGKSNKSVAGDLFISERTVDRHVSNIFNKLSVSSRVEAATFALKHKMLDDEF